MRGICENVRKWIRGFDDQSLTIPFKIYLRKKFENTFTKSFRNDQDILHFEKQKLLHGFGGIGIS